MRSTFDTPVGPVILETPPGVHAIAPSTLEMARRLDARPGERVLELGCGAGLLAIVAAKQGAQVTATDLDARACEVARANARANGVRIEVRQGEWLGPVTGERFDLVTFNPPQTPFPRDFGPKWGGGDGTRHFKSVLPRLHEHLRPGGRVLVLVLSFVDRMEVPGFVVQPLGTTERPFDAEEYEGYAPGLASYLEQRPGVRRTGPTSFVFQNRYCVLRARAERRLIVNADDLGHDESVNCGVIEAFYRGIVRSASVLVRGGAVEHGLRLAPAALDLGLHVDLSFGRPKVASWDYLETAEPEAIEAEVRGQLAALRWLGIEPTHLDGHQHAQVFGAGRVAMVAVATTERLPLRVPDEPPFEPPPAIAHEVTRIRSAAQSLSPSGMSFRGLAARTGERPLERWRAALETVPERGVTELMVHPGTQTWRAPELEALCDPSWPDWLAARGFALATFQSERIDRSSETSSMLL